jgi:hypothetical protein
MTDKTQHTDMLVIRFPKEYSDLKAELRQIYENNKDGERSFNEFVVSILANAKKIFED